MADLQLLSCVAEHRAESGSRELEAGAPGETAAFGQSTVRRQFLNLHHLFMCNPDVK